MPIIDRIKYDGPANGSQWLIYKCLSEQFVLGSQLVVNQGQEVLFFKGGEAMDLFGPGTYTLCTGNLPILSQLVNLPFGGKTPFAAEIYFINKTVNLDLKWGTSTPIPLEDSRYNIIINVGAHGQYGISIMDSRLFVSRIIGAVPGGATTNYLVILKYFNGLINEKIKSVTADFMIKRQISFLEITQYLSELSKAFKSALNNEFERFGIQLVNFYCESIAPGKKEYKKLQKYKEELALGKEFYQQRRSFDIFEKIAENSSTEDIANASINLRSVFSEMNQKLRVENNKNQIFCPRCDASCSPEMKFCSNCGSELEKIVKCSDCGKHIATGMRFCGYCGKKL